MSHMDMSRVYDMVITERILTYVSNIIWTWKRQLFRSS